MSKNRLLGSAPDDSFKGTASIIHAVKTPLGFFSLVVLAVEAIFGITAGFSNGSAQTWLVIGMVAIIVLAMAIVGGIAYSRPKSLYGLPTQRRERGNPDAKLADVLGTRMQKMVEGMRQELLSDVRELMAAESSTTALTDEIVEAINHKVGNLIREARREPERHYIRVILTSSALVGWEGTVDDLVKDYLFEEQDLIETIWHFARIGIIELPENVAEKNGINASTQVKLLTRAIYQAKGDMPQGQRRNSDNT